MKKSNKLLVAGFLALLLFITVIHLTLYAKYKSGDYTIYNAEEDLMPVSVQSFPNILFVSVQNVPYATVQFSDVAAVDKNEKSDISYIRKGDTLLITPKDSTGWQDIDDPVAFRLPSNATLSVRNSSLTFMTAGKPTGSHPVVYLTNSRAVFSGTGAPFRLDQLKVVASDSSSVSFLGSTVVNRLDVQLSNSVFKFEDKDGPGEIFIVTDSLSRLSLPAKQLLKADIQTIPSQ